MPKLTSRDYKSQRRNRLELRRYREFLYGAGVGIVVASVAFLGLGARQHAAQAVGQAADPHPTVLAAAHSSALATGNSQAFTYPETLAKSVVPIPATEKRVKREPAAGQRAPQAAR